MSKTLASVKELIAEGKLRTSEHGYDELAEDRILVREVLGGADEAKVI